MTERSEAMKFFDTVADLQPDQCVDGAERAQCASLWHATRWYRETRTAADAIVDHLPAIDWWLGFVPDAILR